MISLLVVYLRETKKNIIRIITLYINNIYILVYMLIRIIFFVIGVVGILGGASFTNLLIITAFFLRSIILFVITTVLTVFANFFLFDIGLRKEIGKKILFLDLTFN